MRHAILILAHKNFDQLYNLINYFQLNCDIFIHIDKKSTFTEKELYLLQNHPNVSAIYHKYAIHWGGFSILKCELYLLKKALALSNANYFHLISGQDYPIKPFDEFLNFFESNKDKEYLGFLDVPNLYWEENTYKRYQYFRFHDWINARSPKGKKIDRILIYWQKLLKIKRRIPDQFDRLYGGSAWFSITRKGGTVLLRYTQKYPAFYKRLKYTFVPEETYVSTVLINILPPHSICQNNYRFLQWKFENGNSPANLSKSHFFKLASSTAFFARKLDYPYCETLIPLIDKYLLQKRNITISETGSWILNAFSEYTFDEHLNEALLRLCKLMHINSAVDLGCGAGLYVAALRRKGIAITGYDGNPHIQELSSLLLQDEYPCETADLTEELESEEPFDLVLCLDVCQYIPHKYEERVFLNLTNNSKKYIILSWATPEQNREGYINKHFSEYIIRKFEELGFTENIPSKNYLREQTRLPWLKDTLFVFQKVTYL